MWNTTSLVTILTKGPINLYLKRGLNVQYYLKRQFHCLFVLEFFFLRTDFASPPWDFNIDLNGPTNTKNCKVRTNFAQVFFLDHATCQTPHLWI